MTLPIINSYRLIGDETICSMVPCSFSFTIVTAVSTVPMIIMMIAMMPGTMNWTLFSSGLNQIRGSRSIGGSFRFVRRSTVSNCVVMMNDESSRVIDEK